MEAKAHKTVLEAEAIAALAPTPGDIIVDATHGAGGHTRAIAHALKGEGHVYSFDIDRTALPDSSARIAGTQVTYVHASFTQLPRELAAYGVGEVNGILADLGWRSEQFTDSGKGFSFTADEPLQMTYGEPSTYTVTAADLVNEGSEDALRTILAHYGEEKYARRIARAIVTARQTAPIKTAAALADIVRNAVPRGAAARARVHPATRTFQALRIAVNDELTALQQFLEVSLPLLAPGGRLVVITFHSLEDRIVKRAFRDAAAHGDFLRLTRRPHTASSEELTVNPRARSAKLRAIKKISDHD